MENMKNNSRYKSAKRFTNQIVPYRKELSILLLVVMSLALAYIPGPFILKYLMDNVLLGDQPDQLARVVIISLLLSLFISFIRALSAYLNNRLQHRIASDVRVDFIQCVLDKKYTYLNSIRPPDALSRLRDASDARKKLVDILVRVVRNAIYLIFVPISMALVNSDLTLIALSPVIILALTLRKISKRSKCLALKSSEHAATMSSVSHETLSNAIDIKSSHAAGRVLRRVKEATLLFRSSDMKLRTMSSFETLITGSVLAVAAATYTWYGAKSVILGNMTIGELSAFTMLAGYLYRPLAEISGIFILLKEIEASAERYFEVLDAGIDKEEGGISIDGENSLQESLVVSSLSYGFDKREILSPVSHSFFRNKRYLITGKSGAGKSTLSKLVSGMIEGYSGEIYIDGAVAKAGMLGSLVTLIPQESTFFNTSIKNNITLFDEHISPKEIEDAINASLLSEVVASYSNGVDKHIDSQGRPLSYGEKKRLIIARHLLNFKKNGILIMDESLSNMSVDQSVDIFNSIAKRYQPAITITVSHESRLVEHVDEVLFISNGRLESNVSSMA